MTTNPSQTMITESHSEVDPQPTSPRATSPRATSPRATPLREMIEQSLDRRAFLNVAMVGACSALLSNSNEAAEVATREVVEPTVPTSLFHFKNVSASQSDTVVVPEGYVTEVLYRWGDPINGSTPKFRADASNTADEQMLQAGMGHDGMEFFAIPGQDPNQRGLLAVNHEYTDQVLLFLDGLEPLPPALMPLEKVRKSMASHGVSIVEIERNAAGKWELRPSPKARRITADTPMKISGPAAGQLGEPVRGTINNCAAGRTPWGTYLTCEENFQGVFGTNEPKFTPSADQKRYGLNPSGFAYTINGQKVGAFRWWEQDRRFDLANPDNDSKRFGFVVEIDPFDPSSKPIKRTALGRIKHENAELVVAKDGRIVVYMGDDEMNEFVYKFVSKNVWKTSENGNGSSNNLLDEGTLYVARFDADGTGRWLALVPGENGIPTKKHSNDSEGFDQADICIRTRLAATAAGATPMDRPEWVAVHPKTHEVYVSLTNNKSRKEADAANPRANNLFGHILRWKENSDDPAALSFQWKVFVVAGNPAHKDPTHHGNVMGDAFGCPDGLKFDSSGVLWIQTDMSSSVLGKDGYVELGNNMMLAADPVSGEVRRFLTGPRGCEITGIAMTPDRKTMFVNIQHPGEPADEVSDPMAPTKYSNWPDGPDGGRPRSATIAIRRRDGGVIGS